MCTLVACAVFSREAALVFLDDEGVHEVYHPQSTNHGLEFTAIKEFYPHNNMMRWANAITHILQR